MNKYKYSYYEKKKIVSLKKLKYNFFIVITNIIKLLLLII